MEVTDTGPLQGSGCLIKDPHGGVSRSSKITKDLSHLSSHYPYEENATPTKATGIRQIYGGRDIALVFTSGHICFVLWL